MNKSESIQNLAKALASFQAEVRNPANTADNPFYKSKYAPLPDILNDVRPLLTKHGLSVVQAPSGDGERIEITTLLLHESGEWLESQPLILKAEKITPQGAGSAISYGRRYSLSAVLGISSEDDDDGNQGEKFKPTQGKPQAPSKPIQATQPPAKADTPKPEQKPATITAQQRKMLFARAKEVKLTEEQLRAIILDQCGELESTSNMTQAQFDKVIKYLEG